MLSPSENLQDKSLKVSFLLTLLDKGKDLSEFDKKNYHDLGAKFDRILKIVDQEKSEDFMNYIR